MHAVRTIRLCTKDCLCLYVCPTGATDTENGAIDATKCIGCGMCVNACPSHAISLVPEKYPVQQPKSEALIQAMNDAVRNKNKEESAAAAIAADPGASDTKVKIAKAAALACRAMSDDLEREAGFMLPQSANAHHLLASLLSADYGSDFPKEAVEKLLQKITPNERI